MEGLSTPAPHKRPAVLRQVLLQIRQLARRFLLVTIILIGILSGMIAVSFHYLIEISAHLMIDAVQKLPAPWGWAAVIAVPAVVAFGLGAIILRLAPGAGGANLARVRLAYNRDPSLLNKRSVIATYILTPLSLGSGAPLGPEGPTVVVTSGMAIAIGKALKLPRRIIRGMIPVGTAAGIAAIFNTPIAGVVFALEEVLGTAQRGVLGGAIVASVAAAVVERFFLGGKALLAAPPVAWHDTRELIGFALVGLISGAVSGGSIPVMRHWRARLPQIIPSWPARAALGGAIIGVLGLISPVIFGVGYGEITQWLYGGGSLQQASVAFVIKTLAVIVAVSVGIIGGTFAPSLFIGAALGSAVGHAAMLILPDAHISPGAYALVGMGAFFAGLLRNPIASVLIVIELTRDYELILPLMLAIALSISISRRISRLSMVEHQMRDEGYFEEEEREHVDPTSGLPVSEVMSRTPVTVREGMTLLEAARAVAGSQHHHYPVVDDQGFLKAILSREAIEEAARDGNLDRMVEDVAGEPLYVANATDRVHEVIQKMASNGIHRCTVVASADVRKVVGMVTPTDLLRARLKRLSTTEETSGFDEFE